MLVTELEEQPHPEELRLSDVPLLATLLEEAAIANEQGAGEAVLLEQDSRASHAPVIEPRITQDVDFVVGVKRFVMFLRSRCESV